MDKKDEEDTPQTADMATEHQNGCHSEATKPSRIGKRLNGIPSGSGTFRGTFRVVYIGSAVLEKRHTIAMLPWIVAEIVRRNARKKQDVLLTLTDTSLNAVSMETGCCVFEHNLYTMSKFAQTNQDRRCFTYITRESADSYSLCHVFRSSTEETVLDLFTSVKEMTKEMAHHHQNSHALTYMGSSPSTEVTSSKWQHYEVLYVGKIKVSQKRAPPLFIDESVNKFRTLENDKRQRRIDKSDQKDTVSLNEVKYTRKRPSEQQTDSTSISLERKKSLPEIFMSKESSDRAVVETTNITEQCLSSPNLLSESAGKPNLKPVLENCDTPISPSKKFPPRHSKNSTDSLLPPSDHSLITHTQSLDAATKETIVEDLKQCATMTSEERSEGETIPPPTRQTSLPVYSSRAENLRHIVATNSNASRQPHNRTMLFVIGQLELCLLGTDKKQVLLRKCFKDISHCSQGIKNPDYFGFICKETSLTGIESYMGYIFCCQAAKVVDEIMHSLKQAFHAAHQEYQKHLTSQGEILFCETCPLHWFHRLCLDIEGLATDKVQVVIIHRIASLPEADQEEIIKKYQGAEIKSLQEQNEIFMMILRGLCEAKQKNHAHIPNQGTKPESDKKIVPYLIGQLQVKARKQLPGPLELLLKIPTDPKRKITSSSSAPVTPTNPDKVLSPCEDKTVSEECPYKSNGETTKKEEKRRKRQVEQKEVEEADKKQSHPPMSPLRHIFMKVGSQGKLSMPTQIKRKVSIKKGSWRQAIFQRVQAPLQDNIVCGNIPRGKLKDTNSETVRRSKTTLRALWKKAILEQILLIRMENENKKLQIIQDATMEKRIKLAYEELVVCREETVDLWENVLQNSVEMMDYKMLEEAVQTGVPHQRKGDVWLFLAEQYKLRNPSSASKSYDNNLDMNIKYEDLLKQLTPHQHAILIDLGRTFPSHMYYKQTLGSGQLSLFNLLKGYSLLDPEVGYCQGLSFVAGVLLLHMTEEQAFEMMKHVLFHLGFRDQYRPNMVALQVQLYQLSRLVHDNLHDLHLHFERYDVSPALYAAPWFLTLFSSQFPLGFVARLFDLIFLQGMEAVFKVALLLLTTHKDEVINLSTFESIVDYLKTTIPSIDKETTTKVLDEAMTLDVSRALLSYDVEYHVLQEEMLHNAARNMPDNIARLELANSELKQENQHLTEQLQATHTTVHNLECTLTSYQSTIGKLQARIRGLEDERDALLHSVNILRKRLDKMDATLLEDPDHKNDVLLFIKEASVDEDSEGENTCSHNHSSV